MHLLMPPSPINGIIKDNILKKLMRHEAIPDIFKQLHASHSFDGDLTDLGAGYDLFGKSTGEESVRQSIFRWDWADMVQKADGRYLPDIVSFNKLKQSEIDITFGQSAEEFQSKFCESFTGNGKVPGLFSAELKEALELTTWEFEQNEFTKVSLTLKDRKYAFNPFSDKARDLLDNNFATALKTWDPKILFGLYGTHFVTEMTLGGVMNYYSATNARSFKSALSVSAHAEASFEFLIGSAGGTVGCSYADLHAGFESVSHTAIGAVGGDYTLSASLGKGGNSDENRAIYSDWARSVPGAVQLVDFPNGISIDGSEGKSLMPIYMLAQDPQRKAELKAATNRWISDHDIANRMHSRRIADVVVIMGGSSAIQAPAGYEKLPTDLNQGAHGKYIYLCVAHQSASYFEGSAKGPVRSVTIFGKYANGSPISGIPSSAPPGYEAVPGDLNAGANSHSDADSTALFFAKSFLPAGVINSGLRDIVTYASSTSVAPPPFGYQRCDLDLNRGVGGAYIYFAYH